MEGRPLDERELARRARRGEEHAFAELIRMNQQIAFRVAYLIAGDEAEDAVQDAALKAWRALRRFRTGAAFRPWFLRIVANEARNRRRASGRRAGLTLRSVESSGGAAPSPEETVVADEESARLQAALESLPDDARLALVCRYLLELSEAETAAALGVRRGTVKSRVSRALERLRASYD